MPTMDPNYQYQQTIILLTDGLNTQDRWYTSQNSIDARQQLTCNNIKAAGVTLYTIQVNTGGDPTSTLLQNCASSSDKFFLLTAANQITATFNHDRHQPDQVARCQVTASPWAEIPLTGLPTFAAFLSARHNRPLTAAKQSGTLLGLVSGARVNQPSRGSRGIYRPAETTGLTATLIFRRLPLPPVQIRGPIGRLKPIDQGV